MKKPGALSGSGRNGAELGGFQSSKHTSWSFSVLQRVFQTALLNYGPFAMGIDFWRRMPFSTIRTGVRRCPQDNLLFKNAVIPIQVKISSSTGLTFAKVGLNTQFRSLTSLSIFKPAILNHLPRRTGGVFSTTGRF